MALHKRRSTGVLDGLAAALPLGVAALISACSTLADPGAGSCSADESCEPGQVCLANVGRCVQAELAAPRQVLALDVCEPTVAGDQCAFRAQLLGCDDGLVEAPGDRYGNSFVLKRSELAERVELRISEYSLTDPATILGQAAEVVLTQPSRLSLTPDQRGLAYQPIDPADPAWIVAEFPFYPMGNSAPLAWLDGRTLLAEIRAPDRAPVFRELVRDPTAADASRISSFDLRIPIECHRRLTGVLTRGSSGEGLPGIEVSFVYGQDPPAEILRGRPASLPGITDDQGRFDVPVHTYCEDPNEEFIYRDLTLVARPTGDMVLAVPEMSFTYTQGFRAGIPLDEPIPLDYPVCMPATSRRSVSLSLTGPAVDLLQAGSKVWRCCSTSCLPAVDDEEPPPAPTECHGMAGAMEDSVPPAVRLAAQVPPEFTQDWASLGCFEPDSGARWLQSETCGNGSCAVQIPFGTSEARVNFELRIEPPPGAALASTIRTIDVGPTSPTEVRVDLAPRPIVRGRVLLPESSCPEDQQPPCGADDMLVVAERLRIDPDPDLVVGPYFYSTATFVDPTDARPGRFVLPVNPGVYLLTALPRVGSIGAPAETIVVNAPGGTGVVEVEVQLREGVPVSVKLDGFDRRTSVLPLRRAPAPETGCMPEAGAWLRFRASEDAGEAGPCAPLTLDLNAPEQCLATTATGCRTRARTAENQLFASQAGQVQFVAGPEANRASCELSAGN